MTKKKNFGSKFNKLWKRVVKRTKKLWLGFVKGVEDDEAITRPQIKNFPRPRIEPRRKMRRVVDGERKKRHFRTKKQRDDWQAR